MAGFNLQTYIDEFRSQANDATFSRGSDAQITDTEICRRIMSAILFYQNRFNIDTIRANAAFDFVSGQSDYLLPGNRLAQTIRSVRAYQTGSAVAMTELQYLTNSQFQTFYGAAGPLDTPNSSVASGPPRHWTMSRADGTKLLIGPAPNFTRSDAMAVEYTVIETNLDRCYNQSAITAYITEGTAVVELTSTVANTYIQVGDEFGVCPSANFDGTATTLDTPRTWYQIYAKTDGVARSATPGVGTTTYLTLNSLYNAGASSALTALRFITAQVPLMEQHFPATLQMAPVYQALATKYRGSEPKRAAEWAAAADEIIESANLGTPAQLVGGMEINTSNISWLTDGGG